MFGLNTKTNNLVLSLCEKYWNYLQFGYSSLSLIEAELAKRNFELSSMQFKLECDVLYLSHLYWLIKLRITF